MRVEREAICCCGDWRFILANLNLIGLAFMSILIYFIKRKLFDVHNNNNRCLALVHLWTGWCSVSRASSSWVYCHWLLFLLYLLIITFNQHFNGHPNDQPSNTTIFSTPTNSTHTSTYHLGHLTINQRPIIINPSTPTNPFSQKLIETSKIYHKSTIYTQILEVCSSINLPHWKKRAWKGNQESISITRNYLSCQQ